VQQISPSIVYQKASALIQRIHLFMQANSNRDFKDVPVQVVAQIARSGDLMSGMGTPFNLFQPADSKSNAAVVRHTPNQSLTIL